MLGKIPLGTITLAAAAVALVAFAASYRASAREEILIATPAVGLLALMSSQTGLNSHLRYVLPALPFLFLAICRVGRSFPLSRTGSPIAYTAAAALTCALAWNAGSDLLIHPHYISYFNEAAGGPGEGWRHLVESNIDFGQDVLFLKQWANEHPEARPLGVALYAGLDPHILGIDFPVAPDGRPPAEGEAGREGPAPGWYAVSVNMRSGMKFGYYDRNGATIPLPHGAFTYFQELRPVGRAGFSIYLYHVTSEDARALRRRLGWPASPEDSR